MRLHRLLPAAILLSAAPASADDEPAPFAVVELFTSQGCSSSPPGDDALTAIAAEADRTGAAVHPLSFHVT